MRDEGGGMKKESKAVFRSFFSFIPHPFVLIPAFHGMWLLTYSLAFSGVLYSMTQLALAFPHSI